MRFPIAASSLVVLLFASSAHAFEAPRELRGVWIARTDNDVFASRERIADALQFLADTHVNVVFPVVWDRGYTLYQSDLLKSTFGESIDPVYGDRDPLAELVIEAHRRGIEVIPWFEFGFAAAYKSQGGPLIAKKPEWAAHDREGRLLEKNGYEWLNALDPAVQSFIEGLMVEVAIKYDVDGIQGDDRLPAFPATGGYDPKTEELYKRETGKSVPADPADESWVAWRAAKLTAFLERTRAAIASVSPDIVFSSSPGSFDTTLHERLQDSKTWLEKKLVDLVHPQCYSFDVAGYRESLDAQLKLVPHDRSITFAPGILVKSGSYLAAKNDLLAMIAYDREKKTDGEVLYFLDGLRQNAGELSEALRTGPYKEAAQTPYRKSVWRPRALENGFDGESAKGTWEIIDGESLFFRETGGEPAQVSYVFTSPVACWFDAYLEVPPASNLPASITRGFDLNGRRADSATVAVSPGWLPLGVMQAVPGEGKIAVTIEVAPSTDKHMVLGKVVLLLDRKRSPKVIWK